MPAAPIPQNEANRLAALRRLEILDTDPEERFDRITWMAKVYFQASPGSGLGCRSCARSRGCMEATLGPRTGQRAEPCSTSASRFPLRISRPCELIRATTVRATRGSRAPRPLVRRRRLGWRTRSRSAWHTLPCREPEVPTISRRFGIP